MIFSDRLRVETKECHLEVDRHPFVNLIRCNPEAANLYMQFNKISVLYLQNHKNFELFKKFRYNITENDVNLELLSNFPSFNTFVNQLSDHYIEHFYMIQLGLLFGGNMLKKILPDNEKEFFNKGNSGDPKNLITEFKEYLNNTIVSEQSQITFIQNVNKSYLLIKNIFDEFHNCLVNLNEISYLNTKRKRNKYDIGQ
jgi:heme oxygenase